MQRPQVVVRKSHKCLLKLSREEACMAELRPPENGTRSDSTKEDQDLWEPIVEAVVRGAPSWLFSVVIHVGLLIILALILLPKYNQEILLLDTTTFAEQEGEQLKFRSPDVGKDEEKEPVITPENLQPVDDPFAEPSLPTVDLSPTTSIASQETIQIGLALKGRSPGMKKALLGLYGGTATTEAAVYAGLKWLAKNQHREGYWSLRGPYANGSGSENAEAATAMALLAFQGAGHTHRSPTEFKKNVAAGIKWLLRRQDDSGCFFRGDLHNSRFYTQAQATIVVCELYAITRDESLREPAERAVKYLLFSQSPMGGWRYQPQADSDVSVTGWVVMALQSARMAGLDVPSTCFIEVSKFLDTTSSEMGSRYGYLPGHSAKPSMTAEALLCRQYIGWRYDDKRLVRGVEWLTMPENLVNYRNNANVYYWYYATQVMHHMGGEFWNRWNEVMRQEVPRQQVKAGREAGSWTPNPRDSNDITGGRLYVTCLSIYMLEVYYRHLPIYRHTW